MLSRASLPLRRQSLHVQLLSSSIAGTARGVSKNNSTPSSSLLLWSSSSSSSSSLASSQARRSITKTTFILPDHADLLHGKNNHNPNDVNHLQLTKIVATIGPTSEQAEPLKQVVQAGMRIMRLNFSHATKEEVELRCTNLAAAQEAPQDVRAILLDTKGPEIRSGKLQGDVSGHHTVTLEKGQKITLHTTPLEAGSTAKDLFVDYPSLHKAVQPGYKVLLDDGSIILTVLDQIDADAGKVPCRIENTGDLRSRAGVNLPLADTSDLPAMSDKDKADILYGMTKDIDFVAASFVQTADHVRQIRQYIQECAVELKWPTTRPLPLIISKIETAGALRHFDEILAESDAIMVARGDLGVEIPLQQVTNAQKEMVAACNAAGKPVIVATQMLESMSKNPRPTRAEVSDVTNAVYDGADAVMCSGETAKGKYPTETVKMMNEIIRSAEHYARVGALAKTFPQNFIPDFSEGAETADVAIAKAAVTAVKERECVAVLVFTNNNLPGLVAAFRPAVPILAFCESAKIGRQLQLHRGVHPIVGSAENAMADAKNMGYLEAGDEVVIVSMEDGEKSGEKSAVMKIATVP